MRTTGIAPQPHIPCFLFITWLYLALEGAIKGSDNNSLAMIRHGFTERHHVWELQRQDNKLSRPKVADAH